MKIINSYYEIMDNINEEDFLRKIDICGRVCYKSERTFDKTKARDFVHGLIEHGHESVLEHCSFSVKFVTDRGVSHELVRHRIASYSQESTRYCNYAKDKFNNEITVIQPITLTEECGIKAWLMGVGQAEMAYFKMLECGQPPEIARSLLPTCVKTEIICTMNIREWRHFLKLRSSKAAHPEIRELARGLLTRLKIILPIFFMDIEIED
jgi:thymidylate synthase (FAD)